MKQWSAWLVVVCLAFGCKSPSDGSSGGSFLGGSDRGSSNASGASGQGSSGSSGDQGTGDGGLSQETLAAEKRPSDEGEEIPGFLIDPQRVSAIQSNTKVRVHFERGALRCSGTDCPETTTVHLLAHRFNGQSEPEEQWSHQEPVPVHRDHGVVVDRLVADGSQLAVTTVNPVVGGEIQLGSLDPRQMVIVTHDELLFAPGNGFSGRWLSQCRATANWGDPLLNGQTYIRRRLVLDGARGFYGEVHEIFADQASCGTEQPLALFDQSGRYRAGDPQVTPRSPINYEVQHIYLEILDQATADELSTSGYCGRTWTPGERVLIKSSCYLSPVHIESGFLCTNNQFFSLLEWNPTQARLRHGRSEGSADGLTEDNRHTVLGDTFEPIGSF